MQIKILCVISGGIKKDGITLSQYAFLKEFYKQHYNDEFQIDMIESEGLSQSDVVSKFRELGVKIYSLPNRKKRYFKYVNSLYKILKKEKYDIIHVHGSSSLLFIELFTAKIASIPVRIAHSHNTMCDHRILNFLLKPLFKCCCTDRIACGTDAGEWLFGKEHFTILRNGNEFSAFRYDDIIRNEQRKRLSLDNRVVFGHVGSFNRQKNHQFLLFTFKKILDEEPNGVLYLIGDGDLKADIEILAKQLEIEDKLFFAGLTDDMSKWLQVMDIMLFPSLFEGLPSVVLEWQAAGLPSLISDSITEECILTDFVKTLPLEIGAEEWAKEALDLLRTSNDRKENSIKGIQKLQNAEYDIVQSVAKQIELYKQSYNKRSIS